MRTAVAVNMQFNGFCKSMCTFTSSIYDASRWRKHRARGEATPWRGHLSVTGHTPHTLTLEDWEKSMVPWKELFKFNIEPNIEQWPATLFYTTMATVLTIAPLSLTASIISQDSGAQGRKERLKFRHQRQTLMRNCPASLLTDFQYPFGIWLCQTSLTLKSITFYCGRRRRVYTQSGLQVCTSAAFSAGRFLRNGADREGGEGKMPYSCHWQNTFPVGG